MLKANVAFTCNIWASLSNLNFKFSCFCHTQTHKNLLVCHLMFNAILLQEICSPCKAQMHSASSKKTLSLTSIFMFILICRLLCMGVCICNCICICALFSLTSTFELASFRWFCCGFSSVAKEEARKGRKFSVLYEFKLL